MDIKELYQIYLKHPNISTDSRNIVEGCLFFALKGENFNGNKYATQSLEKGASYAIIDDESFNIDERCILVDDVLESLQKLANHHRNTLNIPVLAITGSNGKTTTKELVRDVLMKKYKVKATSGNLNNHIGVPLTILSTKADVEFLIVEMGANHVGEIAQLSEIANPNFGMITNIGKAHLEGFGGVEGIKKGKSELYRYVANHGGIIFLNSEDQVLESLIPIKSKVHHYRTSDLIDIIQEQPNIIFDLRGIEVTTNLYGTYNLPNITFAIACGLYFGVEAIDINSALSEYVSENNRSQKANIGSNTYIMDAYNANPSSMTLSIKSFADLDETNKIMVLGDMLELGEYANEEHEAIIKLSLSTKSKTIFVGPIFYTFKELYPGQFFKDIKDAKEYFLAQNYQHATVLLKGSRGIAVEKILA